MLRVAVGRLLFMIPAGLFVVTLAFGMFHLVPGDVAVMLAGETATEEVLEQTRVKFGFDKPLHVQYIMYLSRVLRGDLGISYYSRVPVIDLIVPRFLNTLKLAALATVVGVALSLVLGCFSVYWYRGPLDAVATVFSLLGICIPLYVVALLLMYLFAVYWRVLPLSGMRSWQSYILPTVTLAVYQTAFLTRMTRTCLLETIGEDYVRTARSKGLSEVRVFVKHALRNAMLPISTIIGLRFGYAIGGAVVVETIFGWPGLGRLIVESLLRRDLQVTQGALLLFAMGFIVTNLLVDVLYAVINPVLRYE